MATTPNTEALVAGVKQYLADMTDDEFAALVDEVREPADTNTKKTPTSSMAAGRERYNQGH